MKKLLLGSSILAAAAFAGAAQADTPKITVGGFTDWQVGIVSEDLDTNKRSQAFFNDTEINFNIDGKAQNGLGYGAVIILEADVTNDFDNQGTNAAATFIYLDGGWGRVELGSNVGASGTMKVDAANIARASGGVDGDFYRYINQPGTDTFAITPDLPLAFGAGTLGDESTENANKITYYSPNMSGFQLGVSYAPANSDRGQSLSRVDNTNTFTPAAGTAATVAYENIFYGGLSYEGEFQGFGFGAAVTAERADAENVLNEDLFAWNAGLQTTFMGFQIAGSYGDWGDIGAKAANIDADYFTLGAAYEMGAYGISVNYIDSSYGNNDFDNLIVGADYQLAPGLTPYAEVNFFEFDGTTAADDNDGTVFLVGTQLNF